MVRTRNLVILCAILTIVVLGTGCDAFQEIVITNNSEIPVHVYYRTSTGVPETPSGDQIYGEPYWEIAALQPGQSGTLIGLTKDSETARIDTHVFIFIDTQTQRMLKLVHFSFQELEALKWHVVIDDIATSE